MVSIHGPLGYEPNTLATAPLRCEHAINFLILVAYVFMGIMERIGSNEDIRGYGATVARLTPDQKVGSSNLSALIVDVSISSPPPRPICVCRRGLGIFRLASYLQIEMGQQGRHQEPAR